MAWWQEDASTYREVDAPNPISHLPLSLFVNTSGYLLRGSNPKKKLDKFPGCKVTNWVNLQQVLNDELSIDELQCASPPIEQVQESQSSKRPGQDRNIEQDWSSDESDSDFGSINHADSFESDETWGAAKKARKKAGTRKTGAGAQKAGPKLVEATKTRARAVLSAMKPPKKRAKTSKKQATYVVDGVFRNIGDNGAKSIQAEIEKNGGKVMKSLSKNVGESHTHTFIPMIANFQLCYFLAHV